MNLILDRLRHQPRRSDHDPFDTDTDRSRDRYTHAGDLRARSTAILTELWPRCAIQAPGSTPKECSDRVVASGRRGLQVAVELLDGSRRTLIALPEYSSHCVISAVAKRATPLPITAATCRPTGVGLILLYDQWGWERSLDALAEARSLFSNASIILDRVDSLAHSIEDLAMRDEFSDTVQVFSLGKTLGLGGGGLVCHRNRWIGRSQSSSEDAAFNAALTDLCDHVVDGVQDLISTWAMSDLNSLPPKVLGWLHDNNLASAIELAASCRERNLRVVRDHLDLLRLPAWMENQVGRGSHSAALPGILPLFVDEDTDERELARRISDSTSLAVTFYHFDRSPSYITPEWNKCIAVPLHWQVDPQELQVVIETWSGSGKV